MLDIGIIIDSRSSHLNDDKKIFRIDKNMETGYFVKLFKDKNPNKLKI